MGFSSGITRFFLSRIITPRLMVVDRPGVVYNVLGRKYGSKTSKKRTVFHFEDVHAHLESNVIENIGVEANDLFYKYGKESGLRYMLTSGKKEIPSWKIPIVIDFVFKAFRLGGMTFAERIDYDDGKLRLLGSDNFGCRKTGNPYYFAGVVSGVMTYILNKNVEAVSYCNCPRCEFVADVRFEDKFIVDERKLIPMKGYKRLNSPMYKKNLGHSCFSDFIRFKKVGFEKSHRFLFMDKTIFPVEAGMIEVIYKNYKDIGQEGLVKEKIVEASEIAAKDIDLKTTKELLKILSAFGFGIPEIKSKESIFLSLYNAPVCRFGFNYHACVINGLLNHVLGKKLEVKDIKRRRNKIIIEFAPKTL